MTLQSMQLTASARTEATIGAWTARPSGQFEKSVEAYKKAYEEIDKQLKKVTDALNAVSEENRMNELRKFDRLTKLKKEAKTAYDTAAKINAKNQVLMSKTAMTNKYYGDLYSVNWFTDDYFKFIDQKAVDVSVFGSPEVWENIKATNAPKYLPYQPQHGTLIDTMLNHRTQDLVKLNQAITQGLIQGKSYEVVTKDIKKILNTSANNARRIARTEGNRNLNSGAFANLQAATEEGIELKRRYVATLDLRTRPQSGSMDGQEVSADQAFTYPGGVKSFIVGNSGIARFDINDRCTSIDIIPGSEPQLRAGLDPLTGEREIASYRTFDTWMKDNNLRQNKAGIIVKS